MCILSVFFFALLSDHVSFRGFKKEIRIRTLELHVVRAEPIIVHEGYSRPKLRSPIALRHWYSPNFFLDSENNRALFLTNGLISPLFLVPKKEFDNSRCLL